MGGGHPLITHMVVVRSRNGNAGHRTARSNNGHRARQWVYETNGMSGKGMHARKGGECPL